MSRETIEVVEAAYAAITRRDIDAFLDLVHPDVEFGSLFSVLEGGTFRGHDGVREWWRAASGALGGIRIEPGRVESFRDRGITRVRIVGTADGVDIPHEHWQAWRIREGKILWWDVFPTENEALEAVGLAD
jgi:ketosteroid isomerase-like protein